MATGWVSQLSGPIPGHKIYEHNETKPYEKHYSKINKSKADSNVNFQGKGCLGSFSNRAATPKDHIQENVKRIREIQRASRLRQEENRNNRGPIKSTSRPNSCYSTPGRNYRSQTPDGTTRTKYYEDYYTTSTGTQTGQKYSDTSINKQQNTITSQLTNNNQRRIKSANQNGDCANLLKIPINSTNNNSAKSINRNSSYLKAHEKTGPPLEMTSYPIEPIPRHPKENKLTVPKASTAREVQLIRRDIDFIRANAYAAKSARMKRSPSADSIHSIQNKKEQQINQYKRGQLPSYLVKRQQQWREDEENYLASRPDPDQPPGHRKMPEKERKATLELLKSTEKELLGELGRLPIRTDTLKLRNKKQEIEQKLTELEEAIKIFSKPKVFIRIDD